MDENNKIESRANECRNIIEQTRDIEAAHAAQAMTEEEFVEAKGRRIACLRALAKCEQGEAVTDEEFAQMIEEAVVEAAEPSQIEINAANIDFLLMMGGEE